MSLDITLKETVFSANVTHNLAKMADAAGVYEYIWDADSSVELAEDLIDPLETAIREMKRLPDKFKKLNPSNKWGSYDEFLPWLERLLAACKEHPNAIVEVNG